MESQQNKHVLWLLTVKCAMYQIEVTSHLILKLDSVVAYRYSVCYSVCNLSIKSDNKFDILLLCILFLMSEGLISGPHETDL